jgi:hypothetical protein
MKLELEHSTVLLLQVPRRCHENAATDQKPLDKLQNYVNYLDLFMPGTYIRRNLIRCFLIYVSL